MSGGDDGEVRDPGLQPERTSLAWQRTGVAGTAVAGLALLTAARIGDPALLALSAFGTAACAVAAAVAATRPQPGLAGRLPSAWLRLLAAASIPFVLAALGLALAAAPR